MSYDVLKIIASASLGNAPTGADAAFPQWAGPDPTIVHVQVILYSSLATSILAAFIAMLGKQWLNRYAKVEMRGSVIDRSRHRQRKINGMDTWHFDLVMESLPLMLQAALLLFSYALSNYLFFINKTIASVIIGFGAFGILFYFIIVSAATFSYNCPFQTPLSLVIRRLVRFDSEHKRFLQRTWSRFSSIVSSIRGWKLPRLKCGGPTPPHTDNAVPRITEQPPTLFNKDTDWEAYVLDTDCIVWMFKMSMDADVIMAILKFIPEIVWHSGIRTTPLEKLYDTLVECSDRSSGHPIVTPKLKDKAYLAAKAFLHLTIQRKCIGDGCDANVLKSISDSHLPICPQDYKDDPDLTSTLRIIDCVLGSSKPVDWQHSSFTAAHHAWMGHILLYRAWDVLEKRREQLPDDVKQFILHSFRSEPPSPTPIITDCLFIIGLILEIPLHPDDLSAVDKRQVDVQCSFYDSTLTLVFKAPRLAPESTKSIRSLVKSSRASLVTTMLAPTLSIALWKSCG